MSRLRVDGPERIEPGANVKFTVWARFSDGSETDVTAKALLTEVSAACDGCGSPPILRIETGGMVHALQVGEARLRASYRHEQQEAVDEHHRVLVLPLGTYKLSGRVTEANSGGMSLANIRVQTDSEAGRLTAFTSDAGEYRAFGVRGATRVTVVSEYHNSLHHQLVVDRHTELDLQVGPVILRADEAATIDIRAAAECAPGGSDGALPDAVRARRYAATLTTAKDDRVFVRLAGGNFAAFPLTGGGSQGSGFTGRRVNGGLFFGIAGYYSDDESLSFPDVFEQLSDGTFFTFDGSTTISGGSRLSGPLDGTLAVYTADFGHGGWRPRQRIAGCTSAVHEFVLSK